jgi:transketolase
MELLPEIKTTTYLRLGKEDLGDVHDAPWNGNVGDVAKIKEGNGGLVFLATGAMVKTALEVVAEAFPDAQVWSAPFIKPIDEDALVALAGNVRAIVTLEEHSIHGGLGGMVAETLAAACPRRILRVGIDDKFSGTCGTYAHLRREHGLDAAGIIAKTRAFLGKG